MNSRRTHKKNLIVSFKNLSEELLLLFKEKYPEGYKDYLQRYDKPNGESIFVVPLETDDTVYMIKFEVKVDTAYDDDDMGKDFFDEEIEKADETLAPLQEAIDKEENSDSHTERVVRHGAYEELLEKETKKKKPAAGSLSEIGEELAEAFRDDEDFDEFDDDDEEDNDKDEDDEFEPSDEDLMEIDIDSDFFKDAEIPPEELARMAAEEQPAKGKRGRKPKAAAAAPAAPAAPKKKGRPRKS